MSSIKANSRSDSEFSSTEMTEDNSDKRSKPMAVEVAQTALKLVGLLACLYAFIISLDLMSSAFRLVGGKRAGEFLQNSELLSNPIAGLMVGVLATLLLQSSSTTTSIIVTMCGAGLLSLRQAAFLVMGANIGTSVTNTVVAVTHIRNREEFQRSFAGATVHDVFNWLCVLCFLPLEAAFGFLDKIVTLLSGAILGTSAAGNSGLKFDVIKVITKPVSDLVVSLDSSIVNDPNKLAEAVTILKLCCKSLKSETCANSTTYSDSSCANKTIVSVCLSNCTHLAATLNNANWSDATIGIVLLVVSLIGLSACLVMLVRTLKSLLGETVKRQIQKLTKSDKFGALIGYICILFGAFMTFLLQSSSVFTSAVTPLMGSGVIDMKVMFPLTLGSNIGTTITSLLAALAVGTEPALQTSLLHLLFNILGIIIWYPVPVLRAVPVAVAELLGRTTAKYRWFAFAYLILCFLIIPLTFFGLSAVHWAASVTAAAAVVLLLAAVGSINLLQSKKPHLLPVRLRDWNWLPLCLRSLQPIDDLLSKVYHAVTRCCKCGKVDTAVDEHEVSMEHRQSSSLSVEDGKKSEAIETKI